MAEPIRNAARTRAKILKNATAEFALRGFDGARVDSIAARSRVNKHMLYHYFGSKEGLFTAVLEAMYGSIREQQKDLSLLDLSPSEAMRNLVAQTYQVILAHPEFIGLLTSENLMKARHIRASATVREMYGPLLSVLRVVLQRGAATGEFRADIDPIELYISIGALSFHSLSNQHTLKAIFNVDLVSPAAIQRRLAHITDMVMAYCTSEHAAATPVKGAATLSEGAISN